MRTVYPMRWRRGLSHGVYPLTFCFCTTPHSHRLVVGAHDLYNASYLSDHFFHEIRLEEYLDLEAGEVLFGIDFLHVQRLDVDLLAEHCSGDVIERARSVFGVDRYLVSSRTVHTFT